MQYAQTNLQLYNQMRLAGYSEPEMLTVHRAYDLATRLFTAKFRGSGKPLICHLVGTASVLAASGAPAKLLAAAVLHAAYIFGEFGDGRAGMTEERRDTVRREVGAEVEDVVARYHLLDWRRPAVEALHARVDTLTGDEREVLLLRLANEVEDHLDYGVLYCRNADQRRQEIAQSLHVCVGLASRIDQPVLATELQRVFDEVHTGDVAAGLRHSVDHTYMLMPASAMRRPRVWIAQALDRHPRVFLLLQPSKLLSRLGFHPVRKPGPNRARAAARL